MRILLLGAAGQVGRECRRSLAALGEVLPATRSGALEDGARCEVADFEQPQSLPALIERVAPDAVVNAAAYTAVDRAEDEPDLAYRVNAEAPAALAAACAQRGARLVHYSTDYVFDGAGARPYREEDATAPLGVYGASKREGELAVQRSGAAHMIFRTAWVYAAHGSNFFLTMLRLAKERETLQVVCDQTGTPTPAALIADVTARALAADAPGSGLWHLTARGETSWHGFAEDILQRARALGLLSRVPTVTPIATSAYPTRARRPSYSCLDTSRLEADFGLTLPHWRDGLADVLATLPR